MYNKFDLKFGDVADINVDHYLVFPEVDPIIHDILNRDTILRKRIKTRPEGLETFRWVEQTAMASNAAFADPRVIAPTATSKPTRVEKFAKLKSIQSRISYGLFDKALTENGTFSYVLEKDMSDMLTDMLMLSNNSMWTGTDTSYTESTKAEYRGILNAITNTGTIGTSTTIAQAIKSKVAELSARTDVTAFPTAIYMNPLTKDLMDIEENKETDKQKDYTVEVVPGTVVTGILTCVGILPIVVDNRIPVNANATTPTSKDHKIVLLNEDMVVRHYLRGRDVSYGEPVVFKLGTTASLISDYVAIMFDNLVVEYPDKAHCILTKTVAAA